MNKYPKELVLRGAYGRITAIEDWYNNYDFKIIDGPYCSIEDEKDMYNNGVRVLTFVNEKMEDIYIKILG